ncbi:MAG: transposase [Acidobacteriota bacterium]
MSQERNRLHAAARCTELTSVIREDIDTNVQHLQQRIAYLRHQALELIYAHRSLAKRFHHLVSIHGIAEASGIQILAELAVLPADMSVRQWVAHAGLDPRHFDSGTSVHKPTRISK